MATGWVRKCCMSLPHTTESVQWGGNLVFKTGGKIFAVLALEPGDTWLSFKCSDEAFAELIERPDIIPAPYLARAQWGALEELNTLPEPELRELLAEAYRLVWEKLPRGRRQKLESTPAQPKPKKAAKRAKARKL